MYESFRDDENGPARRPGYSDDDRAGEPENMTDRIRDKAQQAASGARDQAESAVDRGRIRAASTLSGVARALLQSSEESDGTTRRVVERAGQEVQRLSDFVERTPPREMLARTERLARRQPALFLGGAFALGLLAARFLKSSRQNEEPDDEQALRRSYTPDRRSPASYDRERSVPSYLDASAPEATLDYDAMRQPSTRPYKRDDAVDFEQY